MHKKTSEQLKTT